MDARIQRAVEQRIRSVVNAAVFRGAAILLRRVKELLSQSRTERDSQAASAPGSPPATMTGTLHRSYTMVVTKAEPGETVASARVGTNLVYARIHEFGGILSPKNVKYLTVPIGRYGRKMRRQYRSLRDIPGTFFVRSKKGNLILMAKTGKKQAVPIAALKKRVLMPPRPHLRPAFLQTREQIRSLIKKSLGARR